MTLPDSVVLYGSRQPLPPCVRLWAGPLSLVYQAGDIRYLTLGDREILRRVYVAVRDPNWGTIPATLDNVCILRRAHSFEIRYDARHRHGTTDFAWHGRIVGEPNGTIIFDMAGEALSTFRYNRIGFCVLHPMAECSGTECVVEHTDAALEPGAFPREISPHQPFRQIGAIRHRVTDNVWARVEMTGDTFEMEDQRNWTDASFKTYNTPLHLPFPFTMQEGTHIAQSIRLEMLASAPAVAAKRQPLPPTVTLGETIGHLPQIGVGAATDGAPLTNKEARRLRALNLGHLWAEIDLADKSPQSMLTHLRDQATALGLPLEISVVLSERPDRDLASLIDALRIVRPHVSAWYVHRKGSPVTPAEVADSARAALRHYDPRARIGGGARTHYTELNRNRPAPGTLDTICYAITPQVHAFDNASLIETLPTQAVTVENARRFAGGAPLAIHSVTLKPRLNPVATSPEPPAAPGEMPAQVDARQMSLFGAAWTLGSLKHLAEAQVDVVTYYETTGWLGIMERLEGSPLPRAFTSVPGGVYPIYHVLKAVGECADWRVVRTRSSAPLTVEALALSSQAKTRVLIANLSSHQQMVCIRGLADAHVMWRLSAANAERAMMAPESFGAGSPGQRHPPGQSPEFALPAYALLLLESQTPHGGDTS